jgi:hypothetical protein
MFHAITMSLAREPDHVDGLLQNSRPSAFGSGLKGP